MTGLILKTSKLMIHKVLSLYYLHLCNPLATVSLLDHLLLYPERGTIAELYHDWDTLTKLENLVKETWPRISLWKSLFN